MYFKDLSPYAYNLEGGEAGDSGNAINVGWLENGYAFNVGRTPWVFRLKLRILAKDLKNLMWGVHEYELCEGEGRKLGGTAKFTSMGRTE